MHTVRSHSSQYCFSPAADSSTYPDVSLQALECAHVQTDRTGHLVTYTSKVQVISVGLRGETLLNLFIFLRMEVKNKIKIKELDIWDSTLFFFFFLKH